MKCNLRYVFLLPFSLIYSSITYFRNLLYDKKVLTSKSSQIPLISIGNLAVGGTGKTPHVEFILSVLQNSCKVAMLSRGYKRKTSGFYTADKNACYETLGDEPFQVFRKFPNVVVAVDENRVRAVEKLTGLYPELEAIVLDDAFQHRQISAGLSILLTRYNNLYADDYHLPGGNLRENSKGAHRADILIVTKCPKDIKQNEIKIIQAKLNPALHQKLFFSCYEYDEIQPLFPTLSEKSLTLNEIKKQKAGILIVSGIVSPQPLIEKLSEFSEITKTMNFADHHDFKSKDIKNIEQKYNQLSSKEKFIIVTEKDAARLVDNAFIPENLKSKFYYLPVKVKILNNKETEFIKIITDYVTENSRNC